MPFSLVHQVSSQALVAFDAPKRIVGLLSVFGIAWGLKFFAGPLVDGTMTLKRWVVAAEIVLAALVTALALPLGGDRVLFVFGVFGLVAVAAAIHDVAIDGYYIAALETKTQAAFSGLRVAAYRLAMLAASGGLVILAGKTSFELSFLVAGLALGGLAFFHAKVLVPTEREPNPPPAIAGLYRAAVREPGALVAVLFLLTYRAGDSLMFAMNTPFLASLGLDTASRGLWQGVVGTLCSITGAIAGGYWISRTSLQTTLPWIAALQAASIGLYVLLASCAAPLLLVGLVVAFEQLMAGIGTAGLTVFILYRSQGENKASRFAFLTALTSLGAAATGTASGFLVERVGYVSFFAIALAAAIPGVLLSLIVPKGDEPAVLRSPF